MSTDELRDALRSLSTMTEQAVGGGWRPSWDTLLQVHRALGAAPVVFVSADIEEVAGRRGTRHGRVTYFSAGLVAQATLSAAPHGEMGVNADQGEMQVRVVPRRTLVSVEFRTPVIPARRGPRFAEDREEWEWGTVVELRYRDLPEVVAVTVGRSRLDLAGFYPHLLDDLAAV